MSARLADPRDVEAVAAALERWSAEPPEVIEGALRYARTVRMRVMQAATAKGQTRDRAAGDLDAIERAGRRLPELASQHGAARARLSTADRELANARRALTQIDAAISDFRSTARTVRAFTDEQTTAATGALRRYAEGLERVLAVGFDAPSRPGSRTSAAAGASDVEAGNATAGSSSPGAGRPEISIASLDVIDDADAGGGAGKTSAADMAWGLERLDRVVWPAVRRGKGADYFAQRDAAEHLDPTSDRSYTSVFRAFFDADRAVKLSRRSDGALEVVNGYHRIAAARALGLRELPAIVRERS